jgi:hypothetical protein
MLASVINEAGVLLPEPGVGAMSRPVITVRQNPVRDEVDVQIGRERVNISGKTMSELEYSTERLIEDLYDAAVRDVRASLRPSDHRCRSRLYGSD